MGLFSNLESARPSLIDLLLKAQLLAARGNTAGARVLLSLDLSGYVSPDAWLLWKPRVAELRASCKTLGLRAEGTNEIAWNALANWEARTRRAIPALDDVLIALPKVALGKARGGADETPPVRAIQDSSQVLSLLRTRAPARQSVDELELLQELHQTALRLRDFRADALRRVQGGDTSGVLADGLLDGEALVYREGGNVRVEFQQIEGEPSEDEQVTHVPCGEGFWLTVY